MKSRVGVASHSVGTTAQGASADQGEGGERPRRKRRDHVTARRPQTGAVAALGLGRDSGALNLEPQVGKRQEAARTPMVGATDSKAWWVPLLISAWSADGKNAPPKRPSSTSARGAGSSPATAGFDCANTELDENVNSAATAPVYQPSLAFRSMSFPESLGALVMFERLVRAMGEPETREMSARVKSARECYVSSRMRSRRDFKRDCVSSMGARNT